MRPGYGSWSSRVRSLAEVRELLAELDRVTAEDLEDQDLDFKQWPPNSIKDGVRQAVTACVCMANGGGGTLVLGVADGVVGRARAIRGVPVELDVHLLRKSIYDSTDPRLTPQVEEVRVPEGTGRLIVLQVHGGLAPYTDSRGHAETRVGKHCKPLTGSMRQRISVERGHDDFTAERVAPFSPHLLSASAMERLRASSRQERAPAELTGLGDQALLESVGVVRSGHLTRAALLLAGTPEALREHAPAYSWTHFRMATDTDYSDRLDGNDALPLALARVLDRIMADNPIATFRQGLFHFEYRTYPEEALREVLMNAFCHADLRLPSPILVRQFDRKLEITNPGSFVGGISADNILHHAPVSRNPCLVDALLRLRLVNRANLGVPRIYKALLVEGKEPPLIEAPGDIVRITLRASSLSVPFRQFVGEESSAGRDPDLNSLLILQHLLRHPEIDGATAAALCQRSAAEARETLSFMERDRGYLERGGSGRGAYWMLRAELHRRLAAPGHFERDQRIEWEAAKTRLLSVLWRRRERGEPGLSNQEAREITHLGRDRVKRLLNELRSEGQATTVGNRRGARWVATPDMGGSHNDSP